MKLSEKEIKQYKQSKILGYHSLSNVTSLVILDLNEDYIVSGIKLIDKGEIINIKKNKIISYIKRDDYYFIRDEIKYNLSEIMRI